MAIGKGAAVSPADFTSSSDFIQGLRFRNAFGLLFAQGLYDLPLMYFRTRSEGDRYGSLGPKKRALIHPFNRPLSTYTHFPLLFTTENRVPLGAVLSTFALALGSALKLTPGRCKKRISGVWPSTLDEGTAVTFLEASAGTLALSKFADWPGTTEANGALAVRT